MPEAIDDDVDVDDAAFEAAARELYDRDMPRAKLGGRGLRVNEERDVWEASVDRTRQLFHRFDEVFVSFSGGKDSTAMLLVALEAARLEGIPVVKVWHWDEEAIPFEVEDYVRRVAARPDVDLDWLCLPIAGRNACSVEEPLWYPWAPEVEDLWIRPMPPEAINESDPPEWWKPFVGHPELRPGIAMTNSLYATTRRGTVCALVGNRADESLRRRSIILRRPGEDSYITHQKEYGAKNFFLAYPVYDWSTTDIWTVIGRQNADYCTYYDQMEMLGVPRADQRLGPPYAEEPLGRLWTYKQLDPNLWDKMSKRVAGANTASMYGRTVLYGYGEGDDQAITRRPGMTWEDMITEAILAHDEGPPRQWVAQWVGQFISLHYRKTVDPILEVPHPITAVSWPWLYRLALRGDMRKRREPPYSTDYKIFKTRLKRYNLALEAWNQEDPEHRG